MPGASGSSLGYADVAPTGVLTGNKNIVLLSHAAGTGLYCFTTSSGTVSNLQVTIDNATADPRVTFAAGDTNASALAQECPGGSQFEVAVGANGAFADEGCFVSVN